MTQPTPTPVSTPAPLITPQRISYAIRAVTIIIGLVTASIAGWNALTQTGPLTATNIAVFGVLTLLAWITAIQEFLRLSPITSVIDGALGQQIQSAVDTTLSDLGLGLDEIKTLILHIPDATTQAIAASPTLVPVQANSTAPADTSAAESAPDPGTPPPDATTQANAASVLSQFTDAQIAQIQDVVIKAISNMLKTSTTEGAA